MKWFAGSIPEAIGEAKAKKAIFVVYVNDSSENSEKTDEALQSTELATLLSSDQFVPIKLTNGSEPAKQFSQIYPLVVLPSIYFISGVSGVPLEVLGGAQSSNDILTKVNKLLAAKEQKDEIQQSTASAAPVDKATEEPATAAETIASVSSSSATTKKEVADDDKASSSQPEASASDTGSAEAADDDDAPLEDRIERAKILLVAKQELKQKEEAETEKERERQRRHMGQAMAEQKRKQEEEQMQQAAQERRRDKIMDKEARERIKQQIAADRAEREARAAMLRGETAPAPPVQPPTVSQAAASAAAARAANSNTCRLQFRLPDGSSHTHQFEASDSLAEIDRYVRDNIELPSRQFSLSTIYPRRIFEASDLTSTLRELQLTPASSLVVLPGVPPGSRSGGRSSGSSSALTQGGGGGPMGFIWTILTPVLAVLNFIRRFVFGSGAASSSSGSKDSKKDDAPPPAKRLREDNTTQGSATTQNRPTTAYRRPGAGGGAAGDASSFRQEGNIHRLSRPDDDDPDNNTWNGNSTEQM